MTTITALPMINGKPILELRVIDLKAEIKKRGIKPHGNKSELQQQLLEALQREESLSRDDNEQHLEHPEGESNAALACDDDQILNCAIMDPASFRLCLQQIDTNNEEMLQLKLAELDALSDVFVDDSLMNVIDDHQLYNYYSDAFQIIEANLFRALPPPQHDPSFMNVGPVFEMLVTTEEPNYDILKSNYTLLYNVLTYERDELDCNEFIDDIFLDKFIPLLKSEHQEEREFVANIIITIYRKFSPMRLKIKQIIINYCLEVMNFKSTFFIYCNNLLSIAFVIITEGETLSTTWDTFYRILLSMHSLPYLFYFYLPLFSCCRQLLMNSPNKIPQFTQAILSRYEVRVAAAPAHHRLPVNDTSREMLSLIEIEMILNTLSTSVDKPEAIFTQVVKPIVKHLAKKLASRNVDLVASSISIVTGPSFRELFVPHRKYLAEVLVPILKDPSYQLSWDGPCYFQQILAIQHLSYPAS